MPRRRRKLRRRKPLRLYRMTIATFWYDSETRQLVEYEMHFKIARRGKLRTVRARLAKLGVKHLQSWLRRHLKISIPKGKLKIAFEREAHAKVQQQKASVRRFVMHRVKGRWTSKELPAGTMSYVRRRRRKKKRAKYRRKRRARR
jgi:hypothetical protein